MTDQQAKIAIRGDRDKVETLWADVVGDGLYALDNLPWYAYGVSLGDIVEALPDDDGLLWFARVVRKSGNRTIRVILEPGDADGGMTAASRRLLDGLRERGCSYEGANRLFVAVNVPANVELSDIADYADASGLDWEYADPTYEELFPDDDAESDTAGA